MKRLPAIALALVLALLPAAASAGAAYEVFVSSFADSNGDGVGDLRGIEQKLDYICALGVDALWLTPIHPSPSYHHYDVTDYRAVAEEFGALADYESLAGACAERGVALMLDLVVNHTSSRHPMFLRACEALAEGRADPAVDWYIFTRGEGQHPVPGAQDWYYEGRFGPHMPDLNLDNEAVRAEIADIIAFWQARGAKGFRLDALTSYYAGAPGKSAEFVRFLVDTAKRNDPDCYIAGECWADGQSILSMYESGIDSLFAFPMAGTDGWLAAAALNAKGAAFARQAAEWNAGVRAASPDAVDAPFLTNHDMARARGMLRSNDAAMRIAAALYLLLPGRPFLYYGEELGMSGSGSDENARLPMLWDAGGEDPAACLPPPGADQKQRLKEGAGEQEADAGSLLSWYRAVLALRARAPELSRGEMTALDAGNDALCAFTVRAADAPEDSRVLVLVNTSPDAPAAVDLAALGCGGAAPLGCVGATGDELSAGTLPPVSCALLRLP